MPSAIHLQATRTSASCLSCWPFIFRTNYTINPHGGEFGIRNTNLLHILNATLRFQFDKHNITRMCVCVIATATTTFSYGLCASVICMCICVSALHSRTVCSDKGGKKGSCKGENEKLMVCISEFGGPVFGYGEAFLFDENNKKTIAKGARKRLLWVRKKNVGLKDIVASICQNTSLLGCPCK